MPPPRQYRYEGRRGSFPEFGHVLSNTYKSFAFT